ncbi:MAG: hypothetical protein HQL65_04915 [Magnetococcales bacterium]|nr:hypothetical protein [Magnetococcales bacterium]
MFSYPFFFGGEGGGGDGGGTGNLTGDCFFSQPFLKESLLTEVGTDRVGLSPGFVVIIIPFGDYLYRKESWLK